MIVKKNVQSSNLTFKQLEVNVDTVFYRFNEEKWIEDDVHVGWIYDEIWYDKNEYIEEISRDSELLSQALVETILTNEQVKMDLEMAIVELFNMLGGM